MPDLEPAQITYLEKPKLLYFADAFVRSISCITPVQEGIMGLSGNGVLLACIDSGVDYAHPDFCAPDGTSRIAILWETDTVAQMAGKAMQAGAYVHKVTHAVMRHMRSDVLPPFRENRHSGFGDRCGGRIHRLRRFDANL